MCEEWKQRPVSQALAYHRNKPLLHPALRPGHCLPIAICQFLPCNAQLRHPWSAIGQGMFAGNYHIDIVPAAQTMIKNRKQAVGIGRKINAHYIRFLIDNMVEETGILMCESVVILLPDMRGKQIIQRSNFSSPGQFQCNFQPFGMLAEHGINNTDESFITIEKPMPVR